ncbi:MAG TPA: hypothetical protein V6C89_07120 [Drouetiella sp.]|jgi:hypothetical protein
MNGKLSRRDFMCRIGIYMTGLLALSQPELKRWNRAKAPFPLARLFFEWLACIDQLRANKKSSDSPLSESDRLSTKMQI